MSKKIGCGSCSSCSKCQPCSNPCRDRKDRKKHCHRQKRIGQVVTTLRAAIQDPNTAAFVVGSAASTLSTAGVSETNTSTNADGSLIYVLNEASPSVGLNAADLYANVNGTFTLLQSIPPDTSFSSPNGGIDAGAASPDFSLYSVLDDDGGPNLRVRVFAAGNFGTTLYSTTFSDFAAQSGSGNGGWFTPDNKYLLINYISTVPTIGPIVLVLSVSAGLPVVATLSIPGFAFGPKPISKGLVTYITLEYLTAENFAVPVPDPPFGFVICKFDESTLALTLEKSSPTMYVNPNTDNILLPDGITIRIVVTLQEYASYVGTGLPYASIQVAGIPTGTVYTDTNNVQIFDFNTVTGTLIQIYHRTVNGNPVPALFLPSGQGNVIAMFQSISAVLNPKNFRSNLGTNTLSWLVLDTGKHGAITSRVVGPIQLMGNGFFGMFSGNSAWLVYGVNIVTKTGTKNDGIFGFRTTNGLTPPTGFNNVLLYSVSPPEYF